MRGVLFAILALSIVTMTPRGSEACSPPPPGPQQEADLSYISPFPADGAVILVFDMPSQSGQTTTVIPEDFRLFRLMDESEIEEPIVVSHSSHDALAKKSVSYYMGIDTRPIPYWYISEPYFLLFAIRPSSGELVSGDKYILRYKFNLYESWPQTEPTIVDREVALTIQPSLGERTISTKESRVSLEREQVECVPDVCENGTDCETHCSERGAVKTTFRVDELSIGSTSEPRIIRVRACYASSLACQTGSIVVVPKTGDPIVISTKWFFYPPRDLPETCLIEVEVSEETTWGTVVGKHLPAPLPIYQQPFPMTITCATSSDYDPEMKVMDVALPNCATTIPPEDADSENELGNDTSESTDVLNESVASHDLVCAECQSELSDGDVAPPKASGACSVSTTRTSVFALSLPLILLLLLKRVRSGGRPTSSWT